MSESAAMHRECFNLLCDKLISSGMSRAVWTSKTLPDCVVKIEEAGGMFQNIVEWETWERVRGTAAERWFAPCKWISPNGAVLIMEKTKPASRHLYPEKMPIDLGDFKRCNYGMVGRQLVCHDYGTNRLFEFGLSKRLIKVNWSDAA